MTKKDEFLKLDNLVNDPDVEKVIEENAITDETIKIKKHSVEYHSLKASDLPMYKRYFGYQCVWYYKLDVIDGKQVCIKIAIEENGDVEMRPVVTSCILEAENEPCERHDWMLATVKVLNFMSPSKPKIK